jgi:hemoglobin
MASTPVDYLYQQLGGDDQGAANVAAVVERLYELALADAELVPYFAGVDLRRVKAHMRAFLIAAVGGPDHYQGRPLGPVHAHLRITSAHYSKVLTYAVQALTEYRAPSEVVDAVAGKLERLRGEIVDAPQATP